MKAVISSIKRRWLASLFTFSLVLFSTGVIYAQKVVGQVGVSRPLILLVVLAALAMAPFLIMMSTAFVKMAVVMSLVRNAIGTQQVPPNIVVTGLAMILTIYVMSPVGYQIYRTAGSIINQGSNQPLVSQATVELMVEAVDKGKEPVRNFLLKHVHKEEQALFYNVAKKMHTNEEDRDAISENDFLSLIPAFAISELKEAFQIGFVIFLPFLIIDIVVANILLSLGMFQISPITLALPFKLLLFVLVDGWHIIVKGLILGYA